MPSRDMNPSISGDQSALITTAQYNNYKSATIAPILSYHFTGLIHIDTCVKNGVHIEDFPYV